MKLSLIIPAYNESNRIFDTLLSYQTTLDNLYKSDYEIIVVSDGNDSTPDIVRQFSRVKLLESDTRLGKGGAVQWGFKNSNGDIVGFVDADLSTTPDQFIKLLDGIEDYDCVIAVRPSDTRESVRYILGRCFGCMNYILYGLKFSDTQCGAKIFRKNVISHILPYLHTTGFEFDIELLWQIQKNKFTIKEVPIQWVHNNNGSSFKYKYIPSMFINLIKRRLS